MWSEPPKAVATFRFQTPEFTKKHLDSLHKVIWCDRLAINTTAWKHEKLLWRRWKRFQPNHFVPFYFISQSLWRWSLLKACRPQNIAASAYARLSVADPFSQPDGGADLRQWASSSHRRILPVAPFQAFLSDQTNKRPQAQTLAGREPSRVRMQSFIAPPLKGI